MSRAPLSLAGRSSSRQLVAVIVLTAVAATGCAGPRAPLDVGIREVPSDVVLGSGRVAPEVPVSVPVPPVALPLTPLPPVPELRPLAPGPNADAPPPAAPPAPPEPRAPVCPTADPRTAPPDESRKTITAPPVPGSYAFRSTGGFEATGADAATGSFPESSVRTVKDVFRIERPLETWFRYDVEVVLGSLMTTTTYTIVPETHTPVGPSAPGAGLYLTRLISQSGQEETQRFDPANDPGLLLLPLPVVPGQTWQAAGTDPQSGMTISYRGEVGDSKARVEACGVPLDAWPVHLDGAFGSGGAVAPGEAETFVADYAFGTAYGGLSLQDQVVMDRTSVAGNVHQELRAIINRRPSLASSEDVPECPGSCPR